MQFEDPTPVTESSLELYFREQVTDCARNYRPPPNEDTCWYLGMMLARFGRSESFFAFQDGETSIRPLALIYGDALEASSDQERCLLLQQLGDLALFLGAVFPERFRRRGIQQDYVIGMGGGAYDYLASNARQNRHVFGELAGMFTKILELVAEACSRDAGVSDEAVLAIYQRWTTSRDPRLAKQLQALGISLPDAHTLH